jgi:hypothetical protein
VVEVGGGGGGGRAGRRLGCGVAGWGRAGEQWGKHPAARSPPPGVVVEAADPRVRVSGSEALHVRRT